MVCFGAALSSQGLSRVLWHLVTGVSAKLLVLPALAWGWAVLLGASPLGTAVAVTPTAAASYMLAREMGGDASLMAVLVSCTTVVAALTMPVWLALAG